MAAPTVFNARYRISADDAALQGHFPGRPVLPAATLMRFVQRTLSAAGLRLSAIEAVKFLRPVVPGDTVDITLAAQGEGRGSMQLHVGGTPVATGRWLATATP